MFCFWPHLPSLSRGGKNKLFFGCSCQCVCGWFFWSRNGENPVPGIYVTDCDQCLLGLLGSLTLNTSLDAVVWNEEAALEGRCKTYESLRLRKTLWFFVVNEVSFSLFPSSPASFTTSALHFFLQALSFSQHVELSVLHPPHHQSSHKNSTCNCPIIPSIPSDTFVLTGFPISLHGKTPSVLPLSVVVAWPEYSYI